MLQVSHVLSSLTLLGPCSMALVMCQKDLIHTMSIMSTFVECISKVRKALYVPRGSVSIKEFLDAAAEESAICGPLLVQLLVCSTAATSQTLKCRTSTKRLAWQIAVVLVLMR